MGGSVRRSAIPISKRKAAESKNNSALPNPGSGAAGDNRIITCQYIYLIGFKCKGIYEKKPSE
jgi:hypothetical protein